MTKRIYIDPPYPAYYKNKLFDASDKALNRDDTLAPYIRLKECLLNQDVAVDTADYLIDSDDASESDYYSFGILDNYKVLAANPNVRLKGFVIFEPPVVAPHLYEKLPELTQYFDRVFIHNIEGDGYSLEGVDQTKLSKFHWPQPHNKVLKAFWDNQSRNRKVVMINGNHKPSSGEQELYSVRIDSLVELSATGDVDLYGRGWDKWWSRNSLWLPYWKNRRALMSIYRGECESKFSVMSQYSFALCFENMSMQGYITEKIFDCFYAGVVPLYLGAKDVSTLIPESTYIDCSKFSSWLELYKYIQNMSDEEVLKMKLSGKDFLQSTSFNKYYDSLIDMLKV